MKHELQDFSGIILRSTEAHFVIETNYLNFEAMSVESRSILLSILFHAIILIFTLCLITGITYLVCTYIEPAYILWLGVILVFSVVYTDMASGIVDWIFDIMKK